MSLDVRGVLEPLLKETNLADMREREACAWLQAAVAWLPLFPTIAASLGVVEVLATFPWPRFRPGRGSRKRTVQLMLAFERLCCQLIDRSAQLIAPTMEVVLRPFTMANEGSAVPLDTITRIVNHVAMSHPAMTDVLFRQCLASLGPSRRWPLPFHHEAYLTMLLNLALEPQLPTSSVMIANTDELDGVVRPRETADSAGTSTALTADDHSLSESSALSHAGGGGGGGGAGSLQLSGSSRMMAHHKRLVGLALERLLEMELSIELEDIELEEEADARRLKRRRAEDSPVRCSEHFEAQEVLTFESPINTLRRCVVRLFSRLADDARHRRSIGACDRAPWWPEVQAFHTEVITKVKRPLALHFIAPYLAVLGTAGEATELAHKVVSAALKGVAERRPSTAPPSKLGTKMAPPAQNEKLCPKQRIRAALHIAPLIGLVHRHLQDEEPFHGLLRRLMKFVGGDASASAAHASLVDACFIQALCVSRLLGRKLDEAADIPPDVRGRLLASFLDASDDGAGTSEEHGKAVSDSVVARACDAFAREGRTRDNLYTEGCPWLQ